VDESESEQGIPPKRQAWSTASLVLFGFILLGLLGVGWWEFTHQPKLVQGLPSDPAIQAATTLLAGPLEVPAGDLRFASSLDSLGEEPLIPGAPSDLRKLGQVEHWVREAQKRHPWDPRIECLLGHLDLTRRRYETALRHYGTAVGRASRYGEARLGYGVTLALEAQTEGNSRRARAFTLRAIGQLAAVDQADAFYLPALYDRAILLERVGRPKEAAEAARKYLSLEPRSVWSAALMRLMGLGSG
jgi:tetratricopeptide (TPR) repeat protein